MDEAQGINLKNPFKNLKGAMPKIILVSEYGQQSSKYLPTPLKRGEKVIVEADQKGVEKGYLKVKHGNPKTVSIFSVYDFELIKAK